MIINTNIQAMSAARNFGINTKTRQNRRKNFHQDTV